MAARRVDSGTAVQSVTVTKSGVSRQLSVASTEVAARLVYMRTRYIGMSKGHFERPTLNSQSRSSITQLDTVR